MQLIIAYSCCNYINNVSIKMYTCMRLATRNIMAKEGIINNSYGASVIM